MNALIPLAVTAMVGAPGLAFAENHLSQGSLQWVGSSVYFSQVDSDTAAVIEVRNYNGRSVGALLGSQPVAQGSNPGVLVGLSPATPFQENRNGIALLVVDGVVVASREVDLRLHPGGQ